MTSAKLIDRVLSHILGEERSPGGYYVWRSKRNQAIMRDAPLVRDSTFHNDVEPFRFIYECEEIGRFVITADEEMYILFETIAGLSGQHSANGWPSVVAAPIPIDLLFWNHSNRR